MNPDTEPRRRLVRLDGAVPVGIGLILLGVLLALDNFEVVDAGALLAGWWPVAVTAAGVWWLLTGAPLAGTVLAAVGLLLLASTQGWVDVPLGRMVFPGLLVVVGGAMLQAAVQVRARQRELEEVARLLRPGGARAAVPPDALLGPSATAVFGDARIAVEPPPGDPRRVVVTATSVFGDVQVTVPAGWRIEDRITRVLGDVTVPADQPDYPESPVVALHGLVLLGDIKARYDDLSEGAS